MRIFLFGGRGESDEYEQLKTATLVSEDKYLYGWDDNPLVMIKLFLLTLDEGFHMIFNESIIIGCL